MSRPIAAIEVNEVPDGGPAIPVELTTDAPGRRPALPVVRVAAGSRAQVAIAPVRMSLVTSGVRARTGRRPVPIVVVAGDTPVTPVVPPSPLLTGLAARWSMDEASGNRLDSGLRTALLCLNSASYASDWPGVEAYLGCTAGTGQNAWTLVATATPLLDAAALDELISRMTRG